MLYLWTIPEEYRNRDTGNYNRDVSPDRYLLLEGRALTPEEFSPSPEVQFRVSREKLLKFDCFPNNAMVPLVNSRVKTIIEAIAPNDVQFFKAKLVCKDGELEDYYFLNITHIIIGIDHEKSEYKKLKVNGASWIDAIHYLTYKPGCMGEHELARDGECHRHLLVSEKIKSIFDKEKITGVWLVRPEDYYHGPLTAEDLINEEKAIEAEEKDDD